VNAFNRGMGRADPGNARRLFDVDW
jgi:hypothetical protein